MSWSMTSPLSPSYTLLRVTCFDFYKITDRWGIGTNEAILCKLGDGWGPIATINLFIINNIPLNVINSIVFINISGAIENLSLAPLCFQ